MMPDTDTMIPQDDTPIDQQPDFQLDQSGDTEGSASGSDRKQGGEQFMPPEQWLGEPDYLEKEKQDIAKGFLSALVQIFAPKPLPNAEYMELTPDAEFALTESMSRLRDTLRYLGTTSIKVVDVPARRQKLYTVTVKTDAARVAGFQANRKKLIITNPSGGATVYLGEDGTAINTDVSYALAAGDGITINAQGEVWCLSAAGGEQLNVQAEFYD